jgi:hypothetical protein
VVQNSDLDDQIGIVRFDEADSEKNDDWFIGRSFVLVPLQQLAGKFLMTMKEYPPSQTPGLFNLEKIQKQIESGVGG